VHAFGLDGAQHRENAEMRLRPRPRRGIDQVVVLGLGEGHELREGRERRLGRCDQHVGHIVGQAHIAEARHVVGQLLDVRLCRQWIVGRESDGVAIGPGVGHFDIADCAAGAALVDHHDRLTQRLRQFGLQGARHQVGIPAGREGDHHVERLGGVVLRAGGSGAEQGGERDDRWVQYCIRWTPHVVLPRSAAALASRPAPLACGLFFRAEPSPIPAAKTSRLQTAVGTPRACVPRVADHGFAGVRLLPPPSPRLAA
jgi:hypothetical protein